MNGSVLGALRLDDSDSLRSEILRAEAEFTVSVSAVEGIPSPSLTRVCIFFDYWFPWNLRFLEYPERTFGMIYRLNGKDFCKSLTVKYEKHMYATKMADEHDGMFWKVPPSYVLTSNASNKSNEDSFFRGGTRVIFVWFGALRMAFFIVSPVKQTVAIATFASQIAIKKKKKN